jgi:DNA-binding FrmR family transcriptional regulator
MQSGRKRDALVRLRRVEGQIRGLQRMVEEDKDCTDVLTQVNSAMAALKAVGMELLDEHVRHCIEDSLERGAGAERIDELLAAVARFAGR